MQTNTHWLIDPSDSVKIIFDLISSPLKASGVIEYRCCIDYIYIHPNYSVNRNIPIGQGHYLTIPITLEMSKNRFTMATPYGSTKYPDTMTIVYGEKRCLVVDEGWANDLWHHLISMGWWSEDDLPRAASILPKIVPSINKIRPKHTIKSIGTRANLGSPYGPNIFDPSELTPDYRDYDYDPTTGMPYGEPI